MTRFVPKPFAPSASTSGSACKSAQCAAQSSRGPTRPTPDAAASSCRCHAWRCRHAKGPAHGVNTPLTLRHPLRSVFGAVSQG
ncbi:MAG: hypothetical protein ACKOS8_05860, partial [Gemmataceae bacterium]